MKKLKKTTTMINHSDDELAIRNLIAELTWQADHAPADNLDGYLICFTEDAQWQVVNTEFADIRIGREALREGALERRRTGGSGPGSNVYHLISSTVVGFEDTDSAFSKSYVQSYRIKNGAPEVFMMGNYRDQYRRTDHGWKLCSRAVSFY